MKSIDTATLSWKVTISVIILIESEEQLVVVNGSEQWESDSGVQL